MGTPWGHQSVQGDWELGQEEAWDEEILTETSKMLEDLESGTEIMTSSTEDEPNTSWDTSRERESDRLTTTIVGDSCNERDCNELVRQVFGAMWEFPSNRNLIASIKQDLEYLNINPSETCIQLMSKYAFRKYLK